MYRMRSCSVKHARLLKALNGGVEFVLRSLNPLLGSLGYKRPGKSFVAVEKIIKGFLLGAAAMGVSNILCLTADRVAQATQEQGQ